MITAGPFTALVGIDPDRFETKLRRVRRATELSVKRADVVDAATVEVVPVKMPAAGRWAKFDFVDALLMACALKLEAGGMSWATAARTVLAAGARGYFGRAIGATDFWISRSVDDGGAVSHRSGDALDVNVPGAVMTARLNVSDVARELHERAHEMGLRIAGRDIAHG